MNFAIFKAMLLNIGLLVLIAQVLAGFRVVRRIIVYEEESIRDQILLIVIFSAITVISNYTGYSVKGAIANTRIIGVMTSGFISGPVVGLIVGLVGAVHRYLIDVGGFTTLACSISTFLGGIVAATLFRYVKVNKYRARDLFLITFIIESIQMLLILIMSKPFEEAFLVVKEIFLPMTIFNSIGMVLFTGIFKNVINEQENQIGRKVGLSFDITKQCLPILKSGEYNKESCAKMGEIILDFSKDLAVVFTNRDTILSISGDLGLLKEASGLPDIAREVMDKKEVIVVEDASEDDIFHRPLKNMIAIGAPLVKWKQVFGTIIIFSRKHRISYQSQIYFADGLSKLLSTQYELADMEKQKELLIKSEYKALQSQINPHFIFNSLNTISSFVRENPDDARELLIALATYFRNSIKNKDALVSIYEEMEYVDAYLQLVKARFGDRLTITMHIGDKIDCQIPCLIVQPIVENAVIHGAMTRKMGYVDIRVRDKGDYALISVEDNGPGIAVSIIEGLDSEDDNIEGVGLANVHKRLKYIYGEDNGLKIKSTSSGTRIDLRIPKIGPKDLER